MQSLGAGIHNMEAFVTDAVIHSPDHVTAEHSNVNVTRFSIPRDPLLVMFASFLALSILVNVACYYEMRDIGTRKWLHDYDLNQFQMGPFRDLQVKVDTDEALIRAFGPQGCKR